MKDGFSGRGYAEGWALDTGITMPDIGCWFDPCGCSAAGGRRTTGFPASMTTPVWRGNDAAAGETMPSADSSRASDDLRLRAILEEYPLPAYTLVLLLERGPKPA